jgi:hypothetical protein
MDLMELGRLGVGRVGIDNGLCAYEYEYGAQNGLAVQIYASITSIRRSNCNFLLWMRIISGVKEILLKAHFRLTSN